MENSKSLPFISLLSGVLLHTLSCSDKPMPELIPREVLFGNPVKTSPRISPDGKRMAYLAPEENVLNVWVKTIGLEESQNQFSSMSHQEPLESNLTNSEVGTICSHRV